MQVKKQAAQDLSWPNPVVSPNPRTYGSTDHAVTHSRTSARSLGIPRFDVQMSQEGEGRLSAESVRPSAKMKRNKGNRGNVATLRGKITHGGGGGAEQS